MSKIWEALQKVEEGRDDCTNASIPPQWTKLTARQRSAIEALLDADSLEEAATTIGVKESTLRRWLAQPSFIGAYYAAGRAQFADAQHRLRATSGAAVDVLRKALADDDVAVRIRAAAAILQSVGAQDLGPVLQTPSGAGAKKIQ
jgi:hypothetical protein